MEISHEENAQLVAWGRIWKPQMATFGSRYSSSIPHCTEFLPALSYQQSHQVIRGTCHRVDHANWLWFDRSLCLCLCRHCGLSITRFWGVLLVLTKGA